MSVLLADIGGTSSRWALLAEGEEPAIWEDLPGFNPATGDPDAFIGGVRRMADASVGEHVRELIVYGAGCGTDERKAVMRAVLQPIWPQAVITVENDLLGTARGLCGSSSGTVLILGTGMNIGYFDGTLLEQPMPSLGYVLGDEGSGADIGKQLLADALYGRLPDDLDEALFKEPLSLSGVIASTYRAQRPQAYLASFTALLASHTDHPYVHDLLVGRFRALATLIQRFFPLPEHAQIHATGSVALGFQDLLGPCLAEHGMRLTDVQRDPLAGLIRFHRQQAR